MAEPVASFVVGAGLVIWATERLLRGLVGLARLLAVSTFAVAAVVSGLEAENVAVGLAPGAQSSGAIALGTVFGGASFLVCASFSSPRSRTLSASTGSARASRGGMAITRPA